MTKNNIITKTNRKHENGKYENIEKNNTASQYKSSS